MRLVLLVILIALTGAHANASLTERTVVPACSAAQLDAHECFTQYDGGHYGDAPDVCPEAIVPLLGLGNNATGGILVPGDDPVDNYRFIVPQADVGSLIHVRVGPGAGVLPPATSHGSPLPLMLQVWNGDCLSLVQGDLMLIEDGGAILSFVAPNPGGYVAEVRFGDPHVEPPGAPLPSPTGAGAATCHPMCFEKIINPTLGYNMSAIVGNGP